MRKALFGALCVAAISLVAVGCGGGGTGGTIRGGGSAAASDVVQFCNDYGESVGLFGGTGGDTTDPDWIRATALLGKAEGEAPDSVRSHISKLYDIATAALKEAGNGRAYSAKDFNAEQQAIAPWATAHCPD